MLIAVKHLVRRRPFTSFRVKISNHTSSGTKHPPRDCFQAAPGADKIMACYRQVIIYAQIASSVEFHRIGKVVLEQHHIVSLEVPAAAMPGAEWIQRHQAPTGNEVVIRMRIAMDPICPVHTLDKLDNRRRIIHGCRATLDERISQTYTGAHAASAFKNMEHRHRGGNTQLTQGEGITMSNFSQ